MQLTWWARLAGPCMELCRRTWWARLSRPSMELAPIYVPGRPTLVGLEWSHADMYVPGGPTLVGLEQCYSDMYVVSRSRASNGAVQLAMYVPHRPAMAIFKWGPAEM